jgi:hypothetical protein
MSRYSRIPHAKNAKTAKWGRTANCPTFHLPWRSSRALREISTVCYGKGRGQEMAKSSTSKINVALGGMAPGNPASP